MGWDRVKNTKSYFLRNFWGGWFPGKTYNDIPGSLEDEGPIGASECDNVIWYDGALRKLFMYNNVNTVALNSGATVTGIYYSIVLNAWVAVAGDKFYSGADGATPTNRTGALTITAGNLNHWADWQFETNKYLISVNQADVPFKWTGSGNASALGGSPPSGKYVATWQNAAWIANTTSEPSTLYFSNLGDPEVWTADDDYKFNAPITGLMPFGKMLIVFMENDIGVLVGDNNRLLTKVDGFVRGVGAPSGYSVAAAKIAEEDVVVFHSNDGVKLFTGAQQPISLSAPIQNKYTTGSEITAFNAARFNQTSGAYIPKLGWYFLGLPDGADTTNLFGLMVDLSKIYDYQGASVAPHWPVEDPSKAFVSMAVNPNAALDDCLMFGSTDGFIYKFDTDLFTQDGTTYVADFRSKVFDLGANHILQELNVLGTTTSSASSTLVGAVFDSILGTGSSESQTFQETGDTLDVTFMMDSSQVSGVGSTDFRNYGVGGSGRFLKFVIQNDESAQEMVVNGLNCILTTISLDSQKAT